MSLQVTAAAPGAAGAVHTMTGPSPQWPARQKMSALFDKIDTSGKGSISSTQFANAFRTMNPPAGFAAQGASAVFAKMDPKNTGSVSRNDFVNAMSAMSQAVRAAGLAGGTAAVANAPAASGTHRVDTTA